MILSKKPPGRLPVSILLIAVGCLFVQGEQLVKIQDQATAVAAPQIITINAGTVTTIFPGTNSSVTAGRILFRSVQNTGVVPFLYTINSTNVSTSNYHGVVAGGSTIRDGLGSIVDFSRIPFPISITTESGSTTIAVVELNQ